MQNEAIVISDDEEVSLAILTVAFNQFDSSTAYPPTREQAATSPEENLGRSH
jgi:hypothetical protein